MLHILCIVFYTSTAILQVDLRMIMQRDMVNIDMPLITVAKFDAYTVSAVVILNTFLLF